jgi:hypothetical protein
VTNRAGMRAWLGAAVAAAILGGLAVVTLPGDQPAPASQGQATGVGRPLGAVTPAMPSTVTVDPARATAVTELLRGRADALLRRDEKAFLSSIDAYTDQDFIGRQRALFANLAGVPLNTWSYVLHPDDTLDVSSMAATTGADELWAPSVDLRYALTGADLTPTDRSMGYLFARRGSTWYLRSDTALDELGRKTWRGPWDFGPCLVTPTGQGIVLYHPGSEPMADRLSHELDSSVASVTAVWGTGWSQRVALLLPDTPEEMRALVGQGFPVESVVAVAVADRVEIPRHVVVGQRVVLSPNGSRALSLASLRVVLRHEITHVAARADTVDGSPMWLLEGFADYVGYRDSGITLAQGAPNLVEVVKNGGPPQNLPEDKDFRGQGRDLDLAYQQAWSVAKFVSDRYGEPALIALYRKLAGAGSVSATQTDELLRAAIGLDRATLLAGWRQYLLDTLH